MTSPSKVLSRKRFFLRVPLARLAARSVNGRPLAASGLLIGPWFVGVIHLLPEADR